MATQQNSQSYSEEKLTLYALSGTYLAYIVGGVYVLGSVIGYVLATIVVLRNILAPEVRSQSITVLLYVWYLGMFTMLIALWVGHANWQLGTGQTVKSTIGWMKGWAWERNQTTSRWLAP